MDFSTQFIKILDELGKRFGVMVDWSNKNVLPYAKDLGNRLVQYEIATSWITIVIMILLIIACLSLLYMDIKHWETLLVSILSFIVAFFCVATVVCEVYQIAEAKILPEKVIIREIQKVYDGVDTDRVHI